MCRFRQLSPDVTECGCLKAIVLFKPGKNHGFHFLIPSIKRFFFRNYRIDGFTSSRNASRSSPMYFGRLCTKSISQTTYQIRKTFISHSITTNDSLFHCRNCIFQGYSWRYISHAIITRYVQRRSTFYFNLIS